MNRTKIDWCDMTWNPVTGCLHGCEYCYARKMALRFGRGGSADGGNHEIDQGRVRSYHEAAHQTGPYPYGFDPTLYLDRLDEPKRKKKPQTIFVCSMADLFGDWVPDEWIKKVFAACERAPQHRYLFLTKNPGRYIKLFEESALLYKHNTWFGTTCTTPNNPYMWARRKNCHTFMSIEPIMGPFGPWGKGEHADWIIIGAETGNRKGKVIPERSWIEEIKKECWRNGIPLFMKESLRELMGPDFVQEYPWR